MLNTVKPKRVSRKGLHRCGAEWGWCGEHESFDVTYVCPECGQKHVIEQCAAWPCTMFDCEGCGLNLDCVLPSERAKVALR